MRIVWTRQAIAHLIEIRNYIALDKPAAADRTSRTIRRSVGRLANFPNSGRPGRVSGTCELVVPGTPFIVPYRCQGNLIEILGVQHAARQWKVPGIEE